MVAYYTIFGQRVGSHIVRVYQPRLSIATLSVTGLGIWASTGGKKVVETSPPINASNKEEESFVKDFLKKKEAEKAKH